MKKIKLLIISILPLCMACNRGAMNVYVKNDRSFGSDYEIVGMDADAIISRFGSHGFVIADAGGREVPYQITYDGQVIFPAAVPAGRSAKYTIKKGIPSHVDTLATGRLYPDRHDDMAWENDKIGFRAYGPESQRIGDRLYGYDIFLKRDISRPIIRSLMALNNSKEIQTRIDSLNRAGLREEARALSDAKSYHIDHGHGMDCYAVGPTLGAATTAIVVGDSIVYPWCFESYEVLDDGPLRFTVALQFPPAYIEGDTVTEHRLITLDAGTHLNRTLVRYEGLTKPYDVITGIVRHDDTDQAACEASKRYIAYTDPTQGDNNGEIYIGAVFGAEPYKACESQSGDVTHIAAYNRLASDNTILYYWGAGWDRSDIPSWQDWIQYLEREAQRVSLPLGVRNKE